MSDPVSKTTKKPSDEEDEPYVVSGPFSLPINGKAHYEWNPDIGWKVVKH